MKKFSDFLMEASATKVISDKLKDIKSSKSFSYPTPEERRAQIEKEKKDVKESEELIEKENQEHQYVMQSLADKDINAHIKNGKVVVHKDNSSKAKAHLKKIGHGDIQVVHEGFEELEEGMQGFTHKTLSKKLNSMGWYKDGDGTNHDKFYHPEAKKHLAVPRHAGELSRPTTAQIMKDAKRYVREEIMSFKEFLDTK